MWMNCGGIRSKYCRMGTAIKFVYKDHILELVTLKFTRTAKNFESEISHNHFDELRSDVQCVQCGDIHLMLPLAPIGNLELLLSGSTVSKKI